MILLDRALVGFYKLLLSAAIWPQKAA